MIAIHRCQTPDVPDVQEFLEAHWKPGHILATDRALFDWQYARRDRPGEYSIVLGRRDSDNAIVGMLGFLTTSRFDPALADDAAVWLALWKVRNDVPSGTLAFTLLNDVVDYEAHSSLGVIGFQPHMVAMYRAMKFQVGELSHYVLPNPDVTEFELASFERPPIRPVPASALSLEHVDEAQFSSAVSNLEVGSRAGCAPRKTAEYFRARFLEHPIYRYLTMVVRDGGRPIGLLAARVATHSDRRALRIVDYIGPEEAVPGLGAPLLAEVRRLNCEYADVHNVGIAASSFETAGFTLVDPGGPDIVPNHFEPFERRNTPIRYALRSSKPAVLFKADGDQDRPNRRPTI